MNGVHVRHPRDLLDAAAVRALVAAGDVLGDGAGEEQVALHHVADLRAVVLLVDHAHVVAVDRELAFGGRVEADEQLGERRLSRAAAADDRDQLAGLDVQADVFQHVRRFVAAIAEIDVLEPDVALQIGQHHARRQVLGLLLGFDVEHVAQALHRDGGVVQLAPQSHQPHQRRQHAAHQAR